MTDDGAAGAQQYTFAQPLRLASSTPVDWTVIEELGQHGVVEDAQYCARVRAAGQHLVEPISHGSPVPDSLIEALALVGSVSESLSVSVACAVELEAHLS